MKAAVFYKYGPPEVLSIQDIPKPRPRANQVLIRNRVSTVTQGDCELRRFDIQPTWWIFVRLMMGILKPRKNVLGQEFAGVVEEVGEKVSNYKVGDRIFAPADMNLGGYAQYRVLPEKAPIGIIPDKLGFEEAVTIPVGAVNAFHFLEKVVIRSGDKILINGAGGSIGTFGIQFAKNKGANVTASDFPNKLSMLLKNGADEVVDCTKLDFRSSDKKYDIIFDVAGKTPLSMLVKGLKNGGTLIDTNPSLSGILFSILTRPFISKRIITGLASYSDENLNQIAEFMADGKIKPVIDRKFKLEEIIEAHRYVEEGKKQGNLIVEIP